MAEKFLLDDFRQSNIAHSGPPARDLGDIIREHLPPKHLGSRIVPFLA